MSSPPRVRFLDPEQACMAAQALQARPANACPDRKRLNDAFHAYAARYGYGEAKGWAAMRARTNLGPAGTKLTRAAADQQYDALQKARAIA